MNSLYQFALYVSLTVIAVLLAMQLPEASTKGTAAIVIGVYICGFIQGFLGDATA